MFTPNSCNECVCVSIRTQTFSNHTKYSIKKSFSDSYCQAIHHLKIMGSDTISKPGYLPGSDTRNIQCQISQPWRLHWLRVDSEIFTQYFSQPAMFLYRTTADPLTFININSVMSTFILLNITFSENLSNTWLPEILPHMRKPCTTQGLFVGPLCPRLLSLWNNNFIPTWSSDHNQF